MKAPFAALAALMAAAGPAHAIVITEAAWRAGGGDEAHWDKGFEANEALGDQPQFSAMVALSQERDKAFGIASGVWIGNSDGHGYVLTAAHVFDDGSRAEGTWFRTAGGSVLRGEAAFIHPLWRLGLGQFDGADFAIVRLDGPILDAGPQPALYSGRAERGRRGVLVGFGVRGVAPYGHGYRFAPRHGMRKAAAENIVDDVQDDLLTIDLDQPDGPGKNRTGAAMPVSALEGVLAPGDSGGALWMEFSGAWRVVGVNSSGDPGADYQDESHFARVSAQRAWIRSVFPAARFEGDKDE
jgi:hypothetical protein